MPLNFRGPPLPNAAPARPASNPDFERKKLQNARWLEQKQRESKAKFDRQSQKFASGAAKSNEPPPFNAASAPPPEECLKAFIAAGRTATSMEQLMKFLPERQMEVLLLAPGQLRPQERH